MSKRFRFQDCRVCLLSANDAVLLDLFDSAGENAEKYQIVDVRKSKIYDALFTDFLH